MKNTAFTYQYA